MSVEKSKSPAIVIPEAVIVSKEAINTVIPEFKEGLATIATDALKANFKATVIEKVTRIGVGAQEAFTKFSNLFGKLNNPDQSNGFVGGEEQFAFSGTRYKLLVEFEKKSKEFNDAITKAYAKEATLKDWDQLENKTKDLNKLVESSKK